MSKTTPSAALSTLDTNLLRHAAAGKSPNEIGAILNIPPEQALLRTKEILDSRDVWSERERFLLYLQDIYELKASLTEQVKGSMDARDTSNLIRILEQLGKALQEFTKASRDVGDQITEAQAKFMLTIIVKAFEYSKDALKDVPYEERTWEVIDAKFREGLAYVVTNDDV